MESTFSFNPNSPHKEFVFMSENYCRMLEERLNNTTGLVSCGSDVEAISTTSPVFASGVIPPERNISNQVIHKDNNSDKGATVSEYEVVKDTSAAFPETEKCEKEKVVHLDNISFKMKASKNQGKEWTFCGTRSFKPRRCKKSRRNQLRRSPRLSQSRFKERGSSLRSY